MRALEISMKAQLKRPKEGGMNEWVFWTQALATTKRHKYYCFPEAAFQEEETGNKQRKQNLQKVDKYSRIKC